MIIGKYIRDASSFFDKEADYIIREIRAGSNEYEVSKWTKGKEPKEVYRCLHNRVSGNWTCTCPARIKPCKHISMVKDWLKSGKKSFIDERPMDDFTRKLFGGRK